MGVAATLLAFVAITLWSFLAYLGARLNHIPPFVLVGLALAISGLISLFAVRDWRVPLKTFLVGVGGLFGYHFLYFSAFRHAPAIEANLMNYLWPLLIVVLSPLYLPGYRLQLHHLVGAFMGLCGAGLIVTGGKLSLDAANLSGYLLAAGAAIVWASYSLLTKRLPSFPTAAVGGFCLASGLLSLAISWLDPYSGLLSIKLMPDDFFLLAALGTGPMGAAFFAWDASLKRGDPRIIGSLSYLTPLLSTAWLVLLAGHSLTWVSAIAMILIVSGAFIGSIDLFRTKQELSQAK